MYVQKYAITYEIYNSITIYLYNSYILNTCQYLSVISSKYYIYIQRIVL